MYALPLSKIIGLTSPLLVIAQWIPILPHLPSDCNHLGCHLRVREQSHANLAVQTGRDIRPPCGFALANAGGLAHQVNLHRLERKLRCQLLPVRRIFVGSAFG